MSLIEKIPSMSDAALANLLANARHLIVTGGPRQQADAAEILPALEATVADRRAVKLEAAAAKRADNRRAGGAKGAAAV